MVRGKSFGDSPEHAGYSLPRRIHLSGLLVRSGACCSLFACCSVVLRAHLIRALRDCVCGRCRAKRLVIGRIENLQVLLDDFLPLALGLETTSAATASGRCTLWNYPKLFKETRFPNVSDTC